MEPAIGAWQFSKSVSSVGPTLGLSTGGKPCLGCGQAKYHKAAASREW
jgi:hypothetical protein